MRIRTAAAVAMGAMTLSALVIPTANAAAGSVRHYELPDATAHWSKQLHPRTRALATRAATTNPTVSAVSVNSGKPMILGTTVAGTYKVSVTASAGTGIYDVLPFLWHGTSPDAPDGYISPNEDAADCAASSSTTSTCKMTFTVDPKADLYSNALAGSWHVGVYAISNDGSLTEKDTFSTTKMQRNARLTVNAAPEPVKKGAKVTVTGALTRANWETGKYAGYTVQKVDLQFRKKSQASYPKSLKTVTSSRTTGSLSTTSTATVDGYWRYYFLGTSTTPAVKATGDYVDVR